MASGTRRRCAAATNRLSDTRDQCRSGRPIHWLALLLPAFSSGPAWADNCDQLPQPSVTVKRLEERLTVNTEYGYKALNQLGAAIAHSGHQVLGLTRGNVIAQFSTTTPSYIDRTGQWECASPQLTLTVGFSPMTVYVAKEFPRGSCAYNEIYRHELRHVKTYQEHLVNIEKELADTLRSRFATGSSWRASVGQTRERLQRELNERWLPFVQREIGRVDATQALIDTPEEYARVANTCNGEIKKRTL